MMKPDTSKLLNTMLAWYHHVAGFFLPILENHSYNIFCIDSR